MAVVCKHSPTGKYELSWNISHPEEWTRYIHIIRDNDHFDIRRKIPKIIHKVLIQHDMKLDLNARCEFTREAQSSWQQLNPDYEVRYYGGDDCRAFLKKYFKDPNVLKAFDSLQAYSYKCDLFRYCVLYIHGGYYSDWKTILHQPLEQWVSTNKEFVCAWDRDLTNCDKNMHNALIGSVPKSPILRTAIEMVVNNVKTNYYGKTPLDPTGPGLLGKAFATYYSYAFRKEIDTEDLLIGNHCSDQGFTCIDFNSQKRITVKHTKLEQSQNWSNGNNYNVVWHTGEIYSKPFMFNETGKNNWKYTSKPLLLKGSVNSNAPCIHLSRLKNGLGDQLLDMIGAHVVAKLSNRNLVFEWKQDQQNFAFGNGVYSQHLFDIGIENNSQNIYVDQVLEIPTQSYSIAPLCLYELYKSTIDLDSLSKMYLSSFKIIKPCKEIDRALVNVSIDYGIHLRATDKIRTSGPVMSHDCTYNEYIDLISRLKEYVFELIQENVSFFICSEDEKTEKEFRTWILKASKLKKCKINILNRVEVKSLHEQTGYADVRDMFMLSKCNAIISGTKYSTFGMLACLLSSRKTYICFLQNIEMTMTYVWISLFHKVINNGIEMNIQWTYPSPSFNFLNMIF
jgi:hypothetical protein